MEVVFCHNIWHIKPGILIKKQKTFHFWLEMKAKYLMISLSLIVCLDACNLKASRIKRLIYCLKKYFREKSAP